MVLSSSEGDSGEDSKETVEEGDAGRAPPHYHHRPLRDLVDNNDDTEGGTGVRPESLAAREDFVPL